jgi:hypothetical protein
MIENSIGSFFAAACRMGMRALVVGAAMFWTCALLFSQGSAGRIAGTITDQSGGAIASARVTVTDVERNVSRVLTTDAAGSYAAPNLTPGPYTIRVEFQGFSSVDRTGLVLEVSQELRVDIAMQPGAQTQTVTVTGDVVPLNTTNAELGGALTNQIINDLPLNGRNFENLLDLRPGVTKYPGNSGWAQSTNGLRPHDNFFMVEGINSNDPWMAQSVMNAVMAAGDAGTMLPIDAIDEFKTQQNPRAEYGWKPGAVVNVGIKSGSNAFHGTAYAYGRTDAWDASDFFAPKSPLSLEQYGGSVGGRIIRNKLFFFGNYESQQYEVGNSVSHKVPITTAGTGPAANNLIGACGLARAAGNLTSLSAQLAGLSLDCTQLPNAPGLFPINNGSNGLFINTSLASTNTIYSGIGKLDYRLNDKHSFNGLYFISPGDGVFVDNPTLQVAQPWLTNQYARSQVLSGNWIWVPSSTVVNSLRVGYSRYHQIFQSNDSTQNPQNYSYNGSTYHINTGQTNPLYFGLPLMTFQGYDLTMGASWPKTVGPNTVTQFTDSLSIEKGHHALKFGGEFLINKSLNNVTANTKGPLRFSNLQNFFSGTMNRALITAGDLSRDLEDKGFAVFMQDDWRVRPGLTINLGLRYELTTVLTESNNLMGNFIPGQGLLQTGTSKLGSAFNGDHNNFAPRIGFAWDIGGNGKTVIRGGGGIYYEQASFDSFMALGNLLGLRTIPTGVNLYSNGNATPSTAGGTINVGQITFTGAALGSATTPGTVKYGWANNGSSVPIYSLSPSCGDGTVTLPSGYNPQPCSVLGVNQNLRTPYVATFNLGIQRAITANLSLEATYVGNHAIKLLGLSDLNQPLTVGGFSPGWGNPANPTSAAGHCLASASTGYDDCSPDSGAMTAARPYAKQFPYLGNIYQLSNSNISNYNGLQVSLTQRAQHGLSYVLGYTWSHALAESSDNWSFILPINSQNQRSLYSSTSFDIRHHFTASVTYTLPEIKAPAQLLKGWSLNSIVVIQSGAPWGINDTSTDFSGTNEINGANSNGEQWNFYGNPSDFQTRKSFNDTNDGSTGIPYFAPTGSATNPTANAACNAKAAANGPLALASLANLGCYANGSSILIPPAFGSYGTAGANIFRGMPYYNVDLSVTKVFKFRERITAQFRAEAFNILNHVNISNPFGGPGGDNTFTDPSGTAGAGFGFRNQTPDITSSNAVLGSGGPRAIQLGLKVIF